MLPTRPLLVSKVFKNPPVSFSETQNAMRALKIKKAIFWCSSKIFFWKPIYAALYISESCGTEDGGGKIFLLFMAKTTVSSVFFSQATAAALGLGKLQGDPKILESQKYKTQQVGGLGVVDGRASRDAACQAGGSGFDSRSRPDLRLVWKSCSFL
jgi:hypothetical protein